MVLGFNKGLPQTIEEEDPRGTKKFKFSFGSMTRGELQDHVESILKTYSGFGGAEEVLNMFAKREDIKILAESPSVQSVILGSDWAPGGPVKYFVDQAYKQGQSRGRIDEADIKRGKAILKRYQSLLLEAENTKINNEDPGGTKKYKFSFGTMTGSEVQQRIETTLTQYHEIGRDMDGAEKLMDMFNSPSDRAVLKESPKMRSAILGRPGQNDGPVTYFLDEAEKSLAGSQDKSSGIRLERLNKRYEDMVADVTGSKSFSRKQGAFALRIYQGDGAGGHSHH